MENTYSTIKSVQFLVALLKEHHISHIVLSPGGRNIPIAHTLENDPFFTCYSVVDERSAAYFAIGLSQRLNQPVAISCTSSVAASNYLPAITEAFYSQVPLLVLTADRHPYNLGQMENQMIPQDHMYGKVCRKSVTLPLVFGDNDAWCCQRRINEALLELDHHGKGPVQINIPIAGSIGNYTADALPAVKVIRRHEYGRKLNVWADKVDELKKYKRILLIFGQQNPVDLKVQQSIEKFVKAYDCVVLAEHISNIVVKNAPNMFLAAQVMPLTVFEDYTPDLVITFGNNFISRMKDLLTQSKCDAKHWIVSENGEVCDPFKKLTDIFECTLEDFFTYFCAHKGIHRNDFVYHNQWNKYARSIQIPKFSYSNSSVMQSLAQAIPESSLLHLAILNATRIMEQFPLQENIVTYSNVGGFGIDGSMSTFLGQASLTDQLCFLIIGDLSFFYDMNALRITSLGKNLRIILINNEGAAEFHFFMGKAKIPSINRHIAAEHAQSAKGWVESVGFRYYTASSQEEFEEQLEDFINPMADQSAVFEVFTDKEKDAQVLKNFYNQVKKELETVMEESK